MQTLLWCREICPLCCSFTLKWWFLNRTRTTFPYLSWVLSTAVLQPHRLLTASPVLFFIKVMKPPTSNAKHPFFFNDKPVSYAMSKLPSIRIFPKINQGRLTHDTENTDLIGQIWSTRSTAGWHQVVSIRKRNKGSRGVSRLREQGQNQLKNAYREAAFDSGCSRGKNNYRAGKGGQMNHELLLFRKTGIRHSCIRHLNSLSWDR